MTVMRSPGAARVAIRVIGMLWGSKAFGREY